MSICISYSDIMRWREQKRFDILREVSFCEGAPQGEGFYFYKTLTKPKGAPKDFKAPCPFLAYEEDKATCSIHTTKPVACKDAPDGFDKFDICPAWDTSFINHKRLRKVRNRQYKDFKRCSENGKEILNIITEARKWQLKHYM